MSKLFVHLILFITIFSCGDKKNIDDDFRNISIERNSSELKPEPIPPLIYLQSLSKSNLVFTLLSQYQAFLLNANFNSMKVYDELNVEQGFISCVNSSCTNYEIDLFDKYIFSFKLRKVKVTSIFDASFTFDTVGEELSYSFSGEKEQNIKRFIQTKDTNANFSHTVFQRRLIQNSDIETTLVLSMPRVIHNEEVLYAFKKLDFNEESQWLEGIYLLIKSNEVKRFEIRVEYEE